METIVMKTLKTTTASGLETDSGSLEACLWVSIIEGIMNPTKNKSN